MEWPTGEGRGGHGRKIHGSLQRLSWETNQTMDLATLPEKVGFPRTEIDVVNVDEEQSNDWVQKMMRVTEGES